MQFNSHIVKVNLTRSTNITQCKIILNLGLILLMHQENLNFTDKVSEPPSTISRKKISGFFALFDILGFKEILNNNDLEYLENIIANLLDTLDSKAVTIGGQDPNQELSLGKTGSIVFSDTIILYEDARQMMDGTIPYLGPSIIPKSSILLRLAFEAGIPLRGAISYGDYLISKNYFLGKPIVEAYLAEQNCNWSGAILCESAVEVMKKQNFRSGFFYGIKVPPLNPFDKNLIINFPANSILFTEPTSLFKEKFSNQSKDYFALRWDDLIKKIYLLKDKPDLTLDSRDMIEKRIEEQFYCHNKQPKEKKEIEKVETKIRNTVDFTFGFRGIPIDWGLGYK